MEVVLHVVIEWFCARFDEVEVEVEKDE